MQCKVTFKKCAHGKESEERKMYSWPKNKNKKPKNNNNTKQKQKQRVSNVEQNVPMEKTN